MSEEKCEVPEKAEASEPPKKEKKRPLPNKNRAQDRDPDFRTNDPACQTR
jgi:hypothetical protein